MLSRTLSDPWLSGWLPSWPGGRTSSSRSCWTSRCMCWTRRSSLSNRHSLPHSISRERLAAELARDGAFCSPVLSCGTGSCVIIQARLLSV